MPTGRLTSQQRAALDVIRKGPVDVPTLAAYLAAPRVGASRTAASLVRRGLVERVEHHGRVSYRTPADGKRLHELATIAGLYAVDPEPF